MRNPYTTSEDIRCKTCDGTATDDWFTQLRICDGCRRDEDLCECAEEDEE